MPWFLLLAAGLFEIAWVICLKFANGFTRPWPTALAGISLVASVILLGLAARHLPIGTAYAVWTGIGAIGAVVCGMLFLGDPVSAARLSCAGLILAGVIGIKLVS